MECPKDWGSLSTTDNIPTAGSWKLFARICEPSVTGVTGYAAGTAGGNNSFWTSNNASSVLLL